jgi:hypothetical protein
VTGLLAGFLLLRIFLPLSCVGVAAVALHALPSSLLAQPFLSSCLLSLLLKKIRILRFEPSS